MTDIPDDVVERACEAYAKARYDGQYKWPNDFLSEDQDKVRDDMRCAGRVFVEWEREQCAELAQGEFDAFFGDDDGSYKQGRCDAAAAIRATGE